MELTAVAQLRRMVLEHLSRYTWNNELPDHVYDILQEVREDTPRYRCCVYKERAVLKNRIDIWRWGRSAPAISSKPPS